MLPNFDFELVEDPKDISHQMTLTLAVREKKMNSIFTSAIDNVNGG